MPNNAPPVKRTAVIGYGATVIDCEPTQAAREYAANQTLEQLGSIGRLVPPYNHIDIIAGQVNNKYYCSIYCSLILCINHYP
jgi:threonine dehydratase